MKYHIDLIKVLKYLITISLVFSFVLIYALIIKTVIPNNETNTNDSLNIPKEKKNLIVLISIDGLGSNLIDSDAPYISNLITNTQTSYTLDMQTIKQSETMPSHISMVTGLKQEHHGFYDNSVNESTTVLSKKTIFDYAIEDNYSFYAFLTKDKLLYLLRDKKGPNIISEEKYSSDILLDLDSFLENKNQNVLLFIHLIDLDSTGHEFGWNSSEQDNSLRILDKNLESIINDLTEEFIQYSRYYIITADHGGEGIQHSNGCESCRKIPLIIKSENTESKYILNYDSYNIYDVTCIILDLMGDQRNNELDCVR